MDTPDTSLAFTEALLEAGIAGSIGSVGDALDNALMESTIGLFKTELIDRQRSWTGRNQVERETAAWVHWFNTERLHSATDYRPPVEFETNYYRDTTTTADLAVARTERPPDPGRFTSRVVGPVGQRSGPARTPRA